MSTIVEKLSNPMGTLNNVKTSLGNYYKPLIRAGSVKPLWHLMLFTSGVMYTTNWLCLKGDKIKHARHEKEVALAEYYKNHGITPHH
mmetsp:Transcript_14263/g.18009  ORF Transcript_14263/g.18009 Transcript_14263/m.18009 type:complete len:87 (-) Transcript_14263:210-470(-)